MDFSKNLKFLLDSRGYTQADVCRLTDIPTSLMSNYIKGTKTPTLSNSIKLARALNVSLNELAGIDNFKKIPNSESFICLEKEAGGKEIINIPQELVERVRALLYAGVPELFK